MVIWRGEFAGFANGWLPVDFPCVASANKCSVIRGENQLKQTRRKSFTEMVKESRYKRSGVSRIWEEKYVGKKGEKGDRRNSCKGEVVQQIDLSSRLP